MCHLFLIAAAYHHSSHTSISLVVFVIFTKLLPNYREFSHFLPRIFLLPNSGPNSGLLVALNLIAAEYQISGATVLTTFMPDGQALKLGKDVEGTTSYQGCLSLPPWFGIQLFFRLMTPPWPDTSRTFHVDQ